MDFAKLVQDMTDVVHEQQREVLGFWYCRECGNRMENNDWHTCTHCDLKIDQEIDDERQE